MSFLPSDLLAALPNLRRYARLLTQDAACADDMVEETLARARHVEHDARSHTAPRVQLLGLLHDVHVEHLAAHAPGPGVRGQEAGGVPGTNSNSVSASHAERAQEPIAQLFALPLEQREVMVLVAVERMSYAEIAALLRIPVATVMARLSQARERLRASRFEPLPATEGRVSETNAKGASGAAPLQDAKGLLNKNSG